MTRWILQPDAKINITAELLDIAAGTSDKPVRGSGIFVGGHGKVQGKADGGIAPGMAADVNRGSAITRCAWRASGSEVTRG